MIDLIKRLYRFYEEVTGGNLASLRYTINDALQSGMTMEEIDYLLRGEVDYKITTIEGKLSK